MGIHHISEMASEAGLPYRVDNKHTRSGKAFLEITFDSAEYMRFFILENLVGTRMLSGSDAITIENKLIIWDV